MELTEKQKQISADPRYWDWFNNWWESDYSWTGLSTKLDSTGNPLKDLYTKYISKNYLIERFGRDWHAVNLPEHDLGGNIIENSAENKNAATMAKAQIRSQTLGEVHGSVWNATALDLNMDIACYNSITAGVSKKGPGVADDKMAISYAENCYINSDLGNTSELIKCIIQTEKLSATKVGKTRVLKLVDCIYPRILKLYSPSNVEISLIRGTGAVELIVAGLNVNIKKVDTLFLKLTPSPAEQNYGQDNTWSFDYDVQLDKRNKTFLTINGKEGARYTNSKLSFSAGRLASLNLSRVDLEILNLNLDELSLLQLDNCKLHSELVLRKKNVGKLKVTDCLIARGIIADDFNTNFDAEFRGVRVLKKAYFFNSYFKQGLTIGSHEKSDGDIIESKIVKAEFSDSYFGIKENLEYGFCVDFANSNFRDVLNFDRVTFNGIPRFDNATLPIGASFNDLGENVDFYKSVDEQKQKYELYLKSFRSLRQIAEENNNYADVYKFGRLETISKQLKGVTSEVPKSEIVLTWLYGKASDYGQSLMRPVFALFAVFSISLFLQYFTFYLNAKPCFELSDECVFNAKILAEASERASSFAIPPFSWLSKKASSIDDEVLPINPLVNIFSEVWMLSHALIASVLIFLFLLAVRRRMQFK